MDPRLPYRVMRRYASKANKPLYQHTNKEDGIEGRVFEHTKGEYTITLYDLDAEETLPTMRILKDYDEACKLAKKWAEGKGLPGSVKL